VPPLGKARRGGYANGIVSIIHLGKVLRVGKAIQNRGKDSQSLFPEYRVKKDVKDWPVIGGGFMIGGGLFGFYLVSRLLQSLSAHGTAKLQLPILLIIAISLTAIAILGIGSIVGGIAAIRRKRYALAIAGGICSVFCSTIIGLIGLILVVKSKSEFIDNKGKNEEVLRPPRKGPEGRKDEKEEV